MIHVASESLHILRAEALGHRDTEAGAAAHAESEHEELDARAGADRRQRFHTEQTADDHRIDDVVKLLKQIPEQKRDHENEDQTKRGSRRHALNITLTHIVPDFLYSYLDSSNKRVLTVPHFKYLLYGRQYGNIDGFHHDVKMSSAVNDRALWGKMHRGRMHPLSDIYRRILDILTDPTAVFSMFQHASHLKTHSTIAPESAECTSFAYFLR